MGRHGFADQLHDGTSMRQQEPEPFTSPLLGKVDTEKKQACKKEDGFLFEGAVSNLVQSSRDCIGAVGIVPGLPIFGFSLIDRDVLWSEGHMERPEVQPMLWA